MQDQAMRAAFSVWNARLAPVFDVAIQLHLVDTKSGRIVHELDETLPNGPPTEKVRKLVDLEVDILICGAISLPLQGMISAYGIRLIPFMAGDLKEVIQAWMSGTLYDGLFDMPGCRRRRMQLYGGRGFGRKRESKMGRRSGVMGGPGGYCVCPQCKYQEAHRSGVPCYQRSCPRCGAPLIRIE